MFRKIRAFIGGIIAGFSSMIAAVIATYFYYRMVEEELEKACVTWLSRYEGSTEPVGEPGDVEVFIPAERKGEFVNLDHYEEDHPDDTDVDPSWSPQIGTVWSVDGGGMIEMRQREAEILNMAPDENSQMMMIQMGVDNPGPTHLWMTGEQFGIRNLRATFDEMGLRPVQRSYLQGYDSGGFLLDPTLIERLDN